MIRSSLIVAATMASAAAGHAQAPETAPSQSLVTPLAEARQRVVDADSEASAARDSLLTLNALQTARQTSWPSAAPRDPPLDAAAAERAFTALNRQQMTDSDRIIELQDEALARSNARILAVQPAL